MGPEKRLENESYPIDVSEGEEGEDDGGSEWGDVYTANVGVRC